MQNRKSTKHRIWREKEEVKLKELYEQGLTLPQIALQLGRNKNSVAHRVSYLKQALELKQRRRKSDINQIYYNSSNIEIKKFKEKKTKYGKLSEANYKTIEEYDTENEDAGLTPTSRCGIIHDLSMFGVWLNDKKLLNLNVETTKQYFDHLKERLSEISVRTHKSRIKGLFKYLLDKYQDKRQNIILVYNYLNKDRRGRKANNGVSEAKARLTKKEIVQLVSAIKGNDKASIRNRAIVASLYDAGCRVSEFVAIRVKDAQVDGKFPHYYLPISKTRPRDSHILNFSLPYIMEWKKCHEFLDNEEAPFFYSLSTSNYGEALTSKSIHNYVKGASRIAGIKKTVSCHILRDSKAVHCAESQMTSAEANLLFGWGRGSSMFNYYSTVGQNALRLREQERAGKLTPEQIEELKQERNAFVSTDCKRCHTKILPNQFICPKCGLAKNKKVADIEIEKEKQADDRLKSVENKMDHMNRILEALAKDREIQKLKKQA